MSFGDLRGAHHAGEGLTAGIRNAASLRSLSPAPASSPLSWATVPLLASKLQPAPLSRPLPPSYSYPLGPLAERHKRFRTLLLFMLPLKATERKSYESSHLCDIRYKTHSSWVESLLWTVLPVDLEQCERLHLHNPGLPVRKQRCRWVI